MKKYISVFFALFTFFSCNYEKEVSDKPIQISGIYPHLAYYNNEGECGTGAVAMGLSALGNNLRTASSAGFV